MISFLSSPQLTQPHGYSLDQTVNNSPRQKKKGILALALSFSNQHLSFQRSPAQHLYLDAYQGLNVNFSKTKLFVNIPHYSILIYVFSALRRILSAWRALSDCWVNTFKS